MFASAAYWSSASLMMLAYVATIYAGIRAARALRVVNSFSNTTLWSGTYDAFRLLCPVTSPKYIVDGRGWAVIYVGVILTMIANGMFAVLHFSAMIEGGYSGMATVDIIKWFFTHTVRCLSSVLIFYGAVHGARRFA